MITAQKMKARVRRHQRVRKRMRGNAIQPRLCVFRSLRTIYAQLIDDETGRTITQANSFEASVVLKEASRRDVAAARAIGKALGERALAAGVSQVIFDRNGYRYHGRVRAVAEGAREAGLKF